MDKTYILHRYEGECATGYTVVHALTYANDEPPYIMVTYYGKGIKKNYYTEGGAVCLHYCITNEDVDSFIQDMNEYQNEYVDWYLEAIMMRNVDEIPLKPREYIRQAIRDGMFEIPCVLYRN